VDAASELRQRWRITFRREPVASDRVGRAAIEAWGAALLASGLPVAMNVGDGTDRPRVAFAAPLPAIARGEAELVEIWLLERRPLWAVRGALEPVLPPGHAWVEAEDVWLGAPALAGRITAADWLIRVKASHAGRTAPLGDDSTPAPADTPERLRTAAAALLAATSIPRIRVKANVEKTYDLRPLIAELAVVDDAPTVGVRTRFDAELGSGRPDEVIAALGDASGLALTIRTLVRTRLLLADGLDRTVRSEAPVRRSRLTLASP